jgi:predicted nucleotidyltransferase
MNLLEFLKNNEDTRKIFGKKELEIIFRQLGGMPLTQSERNRLSRDIRQELCCIKEISEFQDEFDLENIQNNKKLIKKTVDLILNDKLKSNIKAILLFGSFAYNTYIWRSDIDICVIFNKDLNLEEATKFRIRISSQTSDKIDIQVFNLLPFKIK